MNLTRVSAIVLRQLYLYRDNPTRFFQMFAWGLIDLVLWGFISRYFSQSDAGPADIAVILLSAVLLWGFLHRIHQGVMMSFLEDSWSRNFLNMFATPLKLYEYVAGFVVSTIVTSTFAFGIMILCAYLVFGYSFFVLGASILPFLLILFVFGVSLGIIAASVVLRFGPSAEWFVWPAAAALGPFVGVFYPISTLPHWMQAFASALPPTYVFEGMRSVVSGAGFSLENALAGLLLACLYVLGSYLVFSYVYRLVIRSGQIARFSVESL
jgi:ABC-2 type transport system permease protein